MNKNNPADRLRIIRKSKGWSLQDVERNSNGKWKAVVIGSYERADRAISLKKAISLMEFYQVPVSELFPDIPPQVSTRSIALDLVKFQQNKVNTHPRFKGSHEAFAIGAKIGTVRY